MYIIKKRFTFSASHQLSHLPDGHQCARLHGHNYIVEVELSAYELDANGFVVDYGNLMPLKQCIDDTMDHRHLNDVLPCYTTAENIAKYLYEWCVERWPQTVAVSISETPKTWARYAP